MTSVLDGLRVLIVEDESLVAMLIEDMLEDLGAASTEVATNLDAALARLAGDPFDFAVLDLNLAGVMTYPVADALRARRIPFTFATGYGASGLAKGYESEMSLPKPFTGEDLARVVTWVIGEARSK
jgi:CheY-like chemotaxis protein